MKVYLFLCLLIYSSFSLAHLKPDPTIFYVQYNKGSSYDSAIPYEKQKFIGEHIQFVKKLYRDNRIILGGYFKSNKFTSFFVEGDSIKKIQNILNKDPSVISKVSTFEIKAFTLTMLQKKSKIKHNHKH